MFGFMRTQKCQRHYCGVCKTIGAEYGQAPRLLLNHDTVLIAEIMTALSPEPVRHAALTRRNCFQLPRKSETPAALRYAAATTMLLAGAKVRDHVADTGRIGWRMLGRMLNPRYRKAARELEGWGLPVKRIETELASQPERERAPRSLEQLAGPTSYATAEVCAAAAGVAGRPEAAPALASFGTAFGKLIYVLDAWHDYTRDRASGQFNAIHSLYGTREKARADLDVTASEVSSAIDTLPLPGPSRAALRTRFEASLTVALNPEGKKSKVPGCLAGCIPDDCCCDCDCCCDSCDCGGCDCG